MKNTPPEKSTNQSAALPKFEKDEKGNWYMPEGKSKELVTQQWKSLLGSQDQDAFEYLMEQILAVITPAGEGKKYERMNQVMPLLQAIAPRDELEGMLAVQMIGVHAMGMEMMRRAMVSGQTVDGVSNNVNRVTKLSRTFVAQMEALNKHRGKGQQKMTVEHVTVNKGGQAIVGNVEGGGRDEKKKGQTIPCKAARLVEKWKPSR